MGTIIIVGAGPALGQAFARRFGKEGLHVGLIARDNARLEAQVDELGREGVAASAQSADVLDRPALVEAIARLESIGGPADVLCYNPTPQRDRLVFTEDLRPEDVQHQLEYSVLGAVAAVGAVLPGMIERGHGNLLLTGAYGARAPIPSHTNAGIALAGLRNYAYVLNRRLADKGVYAGTITIAGIVRHSATDDRITRTQPERRALIEPVVVDPADIASTYWDMTVKRDRVEEVLGRPDIVESWD